MLVNSSNVISNEYFPICKNIVGNIADYFYRGNEISDLSELTFFYINFKNYVLR